LQLEVNIGRLGSVVIEFAIDDYNRFLALCDPASREYEILKNGLVVRRAKEGRYERVVEIFGEMREAHLLLSLADKICPTAMPDIAKAISRVRDK
jgi:pentatricopeptide repeat protein